MPPGDYLDVALFIEAWVTANCNPQKDAKIEGRLKA